MRKWLLITCVCATSSMAQTPISLDQAIETGLTNNLDIRMAQKEVDAAKWKVKEYRSIGFPQINGEIGFQNYLDIPTQIIPAIAFNPTADPDELVGVQFGTDYNINASITLSQLLFDGTYITGLKAAKLYPVLSQQQLEMATRDLKYALRSAYYNAVVAKEGIGILKEIRDTTASLLNRTGLLIGAGLTDSSSFDQLSLTLVNLDNAINQAKRNYTLAAQVLSHTMGEDIEQLFVPNIDLTELLQSLPPAEFNDAFKSSDLVEHRLMETQISLMELNTQVDRNRALPSIGAFFTHQQQAMRNDLNLFENDSWFPATIWGFRISVPIFSSFQLRTIVKQDELEVLKTKDMLEKTDKNLLMRALQARVNYASALETVIAERKNIELSEKILRRSMIRYAEGVVSSINLAQVQTQYLNAQSNFISATMQLLNARVELDRSLNQ